MVVVYGVNRAATGIATCSSLGLYRDGNLHPLPLPDSPRFLYGAGNPIGYGVAGMTNHEFTGSAEQYIPRDPMAPYLYAVRVLRKGRAAAQDPYCVVVPEIGDSQVGPPLPPDVIGLGKPAFIGDRAYRNPATGSGPAYEDVILYRAIWFHLE